MEIVSSKKCGVYLVEDHPLIAEKVISWIQASTDFACIGHALDLQSARKGIAQSDADLVVLDMGLPDGSGSDLIAPLLAERADLKIVVFTIFEDEKLILKCIRSGARGYLLKETGADLFLAELRVVALGGATLTARVAERILTEAEEKPATLASPLTDREREVLNYVALGFSSKETADELNLSPHTVRRHIEKIYEKLEVNSRSQAIQQGKRMGIVDPDF
jgi:two-component system NarL family response regulator